MSIGFAMRDGTVLPAHEVALGIYLLMLNEPKLIFDRIWKFIEPNIPTDRRAQFEVNFLECRGFALVGRRLIGLRMVTRRSKVVRVNDKMQGGYSYSLTAPVGRNFDREFRPDLTPKEMLALGVFCGKYMTDCREEFPASWFAQARLSQSGRDCSLNYFGVDASQPLSVWRRKGWLHPNDPRGWFQWYCRYYIGRRMPEEDARQIKRWKAIRRHIAQIKRHCEPGDPTCRPRQRQALLHWAYDSRKI